GRVARGRPPAARPGAARRHGLLPGAHPHRGGRRGAGRGPRRPAAPRARSAPRGVGRPAEAAPVFERLRAWRAATAKELGVPAYVVFHDATLREIASESPTTLAQLSTVSGVGENKLAKFGQQVLDTLASADA